MGRPAIGLLVIVATVGGWLISQDGSWDQLVAAVARRFATRSSSHGTPTRQSDGIRIATLDLNRFGREQLNCERVMYLLCHAIEQFDVVALQNIVSAEAFIVPSIADSLRARGHPVEFVVGERTGRGETTQQFAFLCRPDRICLDRGSVYRVLDPDDLLMHEPLVASFRVNGVDQAESCTLTRVNTLIHPSENEGHRERAALGNLWEIVAADGRSEDDIILLGNFAAPAATIESSLPSKDFCLAIVERPTDVSGSCQSVNFVFSRRATVEFTGRSGVLDLVRDFNLSLDEVSQLSLSLPTWAEFTLYEGRAE